MPGSTASEMSPTLWPFSAFEHRDAVVVAVRHVDAACRRPPPRSGGCRCRRRCRPRCSPTSGPVRDDLAQRRRRRVADVEHVHRRRLRRVRAAQRRDRVAAVRGNVAAADAVGIAQRRRQAADRAGVDLLDLRSSWASRSRRGSRRRGCTAGSRALSSAGRRARPQVRVLEHADVASPAACDRRPLRLMPNGIAPDLRVADDRGEVVGLDDVAGGVDARWRSLVVSMT